VARHEISLEIYESEKKWKTKQKTKMVAALEKERKAL